MFLDRKEKPLIRFYSYIHANNNNTILSCIKIVISESCVWNMRLFNLIL